MRGVGSITMPRESVPARFVENGNTASFSRNGRFKLDPSSSKYRRRSSSALDPLVSRNAGLTHRIVGEVRNAAGKVCRARMTTPQVYAVTFPLAATIAQRVNDGAAKPGFQTPAAMFGKDFILGFDGCSIEWLPS